MNTSDATHITIFLLFILSITNAVAQINVSGIAVDKETNEPLSGASVIVKGADGKIENNNYLPANYHKL